MRKLMWFTIGFAASCALCAYLTMDRWIIPLTVIAAVLAVMFVWRQWKRPAVVVSGILVGLLWFGAFQSRYLDCAKSYDGSLLDASVTASDFSFDTNYGTAVDGSITLDGKYYDIRLYLNERKEITPGTEIRCKFQLRYTPPGGQETATYHAGKGIFFLGYQRGDVEIFEAEEVSHQYYPVIFAMQIKDILRTIFPEDVFPFTQALLLGDDNELSYETDTALSLSGIRHIVAVSGLHVMLLYTLMNTFALRRRYLTALLAFPALLLFTAMAGFTPSVVRACIMVGLMILAQVLNKSYDAPTALSFAALTMLMVNPFVITSVGFQLSVASVIGIQLFNEPLGNWLKEKFGKPKGKKLGMRLLNSLSSSISVAVSAMSLTTPLVALYFGNISLVSILGNLLTLWAVNLIFYGLVAVCAISFLSISMATFIAGIIAWLIRYVLWMAKLLSSFPLAAVYTRSPYIVAWLIFVYLLLGVFLMSKNRRPLIFVCCASIGLSMALLCSWIEPMLDDVRITVMDVGQGQSILLQSDDKTFLVDCGGDHDDEAADVAAETLLSMGIYRLDGIILTHGDRDHAGGAINLLSRIRTDHLFVSATTDLQTIAAIEAELDAEVVQVAENMVLDFDSGRITIFAPLFVDNSNENSLCVLFDTEKCDILITGDRGNLGEMMLLRENTIPNVDIMIAGHHGSKHSTSDALLHTADPEVVIISAGEDNPYGHSAPETLEKLYKLGCRVYRTDLHGTIVFRR